MKKVIYTKSINTIYDEIGRRLNDKYHCDNDRYDSPSQADDIGNLVTPFFLIDSDIASSTKEYHKENINDLSLSVNKNQLPIYNANQRCNPDIDIYSNNYQYMKDQIDELYEFEPNEI